MLTVKTSDTITPKTVAKQVVAGTNYLFVCDVVNSKNESYQEEVLIFKPLPHTKKPATVVKTTKVEKDK